MIYQCKEDYVISFLEPIRYHHIYIFISLNLHLETTIGQVPLEAELSSLFYGLVIANNMQVSQLKVTTDSLAVINILDPHSHSNSSLVLSCRDLLLSLGSPQMQHEP